MNTINATAWANLKKNKGRNILTGIAILLTTFLIFTITTLGSGMIRLQFEAANQLYRSNLLKSGPMMRIRALGFSDMF